MSIYICLFIYVYISVYRQPTHTYACTHAHIHTYIHAHIHIYALQHPHTNTPLRSPPTNKAHTHTHTHRLLIRPIKAVTDKLCPPPHTPTPRVHPEPPTIPPPTPPPTPNGMASWSRDKFTTRRHLYMLERELVEVGGCMMGGGMGVCVSFWGCRGVVMRGF